MVAPVAVICGARRKVARLLLPAAQLVVVVALLHLLSQGTLLRVKKSLQQTLGSSGIHTGHNDYSAHDNKLLKEYNFMKNKNNINNRKKKNYGNKKYSDNYQLNRMNHPQQPHRPRKIRPTITPIPQTPTTPKSLPPRWETRRNMQTRLALLKSTCSRYHLGLWRGTDLPSLPVHETITGVPKVPLYQALLVHRKRHFTFCPISGSGSEWVSKRLLESTGYHFNPDPVNPPQPASVLARHRFPYLSSWDMYSIVLNNSINMIVVRHPFDKLLGYYITNLEDSKKNLNEFEKYGRRIAAKYRKKPRFRKEPTFGEFIQYLLEIDRQHHDNVWQDVSRRCTPCHIAYNIISHYETLWIDSNYAWSLMNLTMKTSDFPVDEITPEIRRQYFSELSLNEMVKLHDLYKLDFELFGYTLEEHLSFATKYDDNFDPEKLLGLPNSEAMLSSIRENEAETATVLDSSDEVGNDEVQASSTFSTLTD